MTHSPTPRYLSTHFLISGLSDTLDDLTLGLALVSLSPVYRARGRGKGGIRQAGGTFDTCKESREEDSVKGVVGYATELLSRICKSV